MKFYNYKTGQWELYDRRITDMTEAEAKQFAPQDGLSQETLDYEFRQSANWGVALLRVLSHLPQPGSVADRT